MAFTDAGFRNLMDEVSIKEPSVIYNAAGSPRILVVDCGLKYNQLRCLLARGACVQVVPWNHPLEEAMCHFDGLFLSNGPGDPTMSAELIENLSRYMTGTETKPIFGICMGHQIIALAAGLQTYRLKYGNRGHNQPCVHQDTGRCYITSQNHGYAVDVQTLPPEWQVLFTNANDGTNEGLVHREKPIFSVQFHPEHAAGPTDTEWLFDVFLDAVREHGADGVSSALSNMINTRCRAPVVPCPVLAFKPRKVLILGSGGLTIGQAGEFDYCGAQAIKALKEEGVHTVLVNPNVATSQTTKGLADTVYFLPVNVEYVAQVIKAERPDGILLNFGGQTALNCGVKLVQEGILARYNVAVLGTPVQTVIWTEDRKQFADKLMEIGYKVAPSLVAYSIVDALAAADQLGFPLLVRAAYSLGGLNSGFADSHEQLVDICTKAFTVSTQLFIDKSLKGWKEVEYEVVRDVFDNCVTVCNMENLDPLGVHTGDSVVVAPSQTLSNAEYHMLRTAAIEVVRHLGVVGECNIQYALDPKSQDFFVVEVNARLSRSSALASKATGFPLAFIAAKLAIGHDLSHLRNPVTGVTTACFEPSLDYCVVKIPRWDLKKFPGVSFKIGSAMKSIGEGMAVGRNFEEAFQKALRMVNEDYLGFDPYVEELNNDELSSPSDRRILVLASALAEGYTVDQLHHLTKIDRWFLAKMKNINDFRIRLTARKAGTDHLDYETLLAAKKLGFCDRQIANCIESTRPVVRARRKELQIHPWVKQIDTVAGEWPACANYLYTTYHGEKHDVTFSGAGAVGGRAPVMVLGSGVYRIGSSVEFDCCAVGCLAELRRLDRKTIMINCNPETVSTDYDVCDRLYFEEISVENVMDIYDLENPEGVILSMGGQLPNNIAMTIHRLGAVVLGTSPESIDSAENRFKFSRLLDIAGILQPKWQQLTSLDAALDFCDLVRYPCLIRPSYVLSGAMMQIAYCPGDLEAYLGRDAEVSREHPVVISKFIENAREIDVDAVAADGSVVCLAISEHVENAGVHSGDAVLITPPQDLTGEVTERIKQITMVVADVLEANGPLNLQLLLKDDILQVIECNLRVSRSFPFVSKTLDYDFIVAATRVALGEPVDAMNLDQFVTGTEKNSPRIGVKAPMFSFARLPHADVTLGVEMRSTGEVAGYGRDKYEAFLKAIISAGFKYPQTGGKVFLGISSVRHREELTATVQTLGSLNFKLYGSPGTTQYYKKAGIVTIEEIDADHTMNVEQICRKYQFDLAINIPALKGSAPRLSIDSTQGHQISRTATDFQVPLVTSMTYAKLLVESLRRYPQPPPLDMDVDRVTSRNFVRLPGLIDIGTCLPVLGENCKNIFANVTKTALRGGITTICCLANMEDATSLRALQKLAGLGTWCDYGFRLRGTAENAAPVAKLASEAVALELFLNPANAGDSSAMAGVSAVWADHFRHWPRDRPVCVHSNSQTLATVLLFAHLDDRSVHLCGVSLQGQISLIRDAKKKGIKLTCDVAVQSLFATQHDYHLDRKCLWDNLELIDCFTSADDNGVQDDAPQLQPSVGAGIEPVFVPPSPCSALERMLPLLLSAVQDGRLTLDDIRRRLYDNPRRIFGLPEQRDTFIEIDLTVPHRMDDLVGVDAMYGPVHRVVLRGKDVFVNGQMTVEHGTGKDVCRPLENPDHLSVFGADATPETRTLSSSRSFPLLFPKKALESPPTGESDSDELLPMGSNMEHAMRGRLSGGSTVKPPLPCRRLSFDVTSAATDMNTIFRRLSKTLSCSLSEPALDGGGGSLERGRRPSELPLTTSSIALLPFRHVISVEDFDQGHLEGLFGLAKYFQSGGRKGRIATPLLTGRVLSLVFYEEETSNSNSYASAMQRLGGSVIYMNSHTSSVQKGESLRDTVTVMAGYSDAVVLRQSLVDPLQTAAWCIAKPLITAGDNSGEDVVQSLTDAFTMWDELGTLDGITVTFLGNLGRGSPLHSLVKLLALYPRTSMRFIVSDGVSEDTATALPDKLRVYLAERKIHFSTHGTIEDALPDSNVLYIGPLDESGREAGDPASGLSRPFPVTPQLLRLGHAEKRMGPRLRVLQLPRSGISSSVELDSDVRMVRYRQAENGIYVRMALLASLIRGQSAEAQVPVTADVSIQAFRSRRRSSTILT